MDGLDVLGAVEVGLVGGEDGEGAAHHRDGRHRRRAEPKAVLNLAPEGKILILSSIRFSWLSAQPVHSTNVGMKQG